MIDQTPRSLTLPGEPSDGSLGTERPEKVLRAVPAGLDRGDESSSDPTTATPRGRRLLLPRGRRGGSDEDVNLAAGANPRLRRGGTISGLLVTLSAIGTLAVGAAVVSPRFLKAAPRESAEIHARLPAHQETASALAALIGRSHMLLALHDRGATPYQETVLWLDDRVNPGVIDPEEVAVLSHSEVLWTIIYYGLEAPEEEACPEAEALEPARVREPAFCGHWRARAGVEPRVIATGISDLRIEPPEKGPGGSSLLRISLTWASDSTDGPDEASVLVDVAMRYWDAAE